MYRFNGQDGRLDRMLEAAVMIMTALDGMESRFRYGIVGHSGDGPDIQFVLPGHPPKDRAEQLAILQKMVATHAILHVGRFDIRGRGDGYPGGCNSRLR